MILRTGRPDGWTVTAGTKALGVRSPVLRHQQYTLYDTSYCNVQVLDLTAEAYLEDGAVIDLNALDELELAAYQPQRRRRKGQRHQEQVRKLITI